MELQLLVRQHAAGHKSEKVITSKNLDVDWCVLYPSYGLETAWTNTYAVFLDKVACHCQGAHSCCRQMMGVSRLFRQVAFEAWKKDSETALSMNDWAYGLKASMGSLKAPWKSSTIARGSYGAALEPQSVKNGSLRQIIAQLELFEDVTVVGPHTGTKVLGMPPMAGSTHIRI